MSSARADRTDDATTTTAAATAASVSFFVTSPTTVVRGMKRHSDAAFAMGGDADADGSRRVKRRVSARLAPARVDDDTLTNGVVKSIDVPKPRAVVPLGQSRVTNIPQPRMTTKTIPAPRAVGGEVVAAGVAGVTAMKSKTRSGLKHIPPPLCGAVSVTADENDAA